MIWRRMLIALAIMSASALVLALFGWQWFGVPLLAHYSGGQITAHSVSGPLWNPTAHDMIASMNGVDAHAKQARIRLSQLNPWSKTIRLDVLLEDGIVNVRLKDLLGRNNSTSGYHVLPGRITVKNMRLNVDGQGVNIPSATLQASGQDGALSLRGTSHYGKLSAQVHYGEQNGQLWARINAKSDARIINEYWPGHGVRGGQLAAKYRVDGQQLQGDITLTDGLVVIPEAKAVRFRRLSGRVTHKGHIIAGAVRGELLGGPVQAKIKVDTQAKNWQVDGVAAPTFDALGKALKLPGSGQAHLTVSAGGWTTVNVKAQLLSKSGGFANVPFSGLGADYSFQSSSSQKRVNGQHTTITRNVISLQADTHVQGEAQKLWGTWHINKAGSLHWAGQLAGKPFNLSDQIDAQNRMAISGAALGGPVTAALNLRANTVSAQLAPNLYGLTGQLAISGPFDHLSLRVRDLTAGPVSLSGAGKLNNTGLQATLVGASGGRVALQTDRTWRGKWQLERLKVAPQVAFTGQGDIDLASGLTGQLQADVPDVVASTLAGPVNLSWKAKQGQWQAGQQRLTWQDKTFGLRASSLQVGGMTLNGQMVYNTAVRGPKKSPPQGLAGHLTATGRGIKVFATGAGQALRFSGAVGDLRLEASTRIGAPYQTQVTLHGADIDGQLVNQPADSGTNGGLAFKLRTGRAYASGLISGERLNAAGTLELAALRPVLASVLGKAAAQYTADLSGKVRLNLRGQGGTATLSASASTPRPFQLVGTFVRQGKQVWASKVSVRSEVAAGQHVRATVSGQVFPAVSLSGPVRWQSTSGAAQIPAQTLQASLGGPYDALQLHLSGNTTALHLGGVDLPAQALNLSGVLGPRPALSGQWGELRASYKAGQLTFAGQQRLQAAGRSGQVNLAGQWRPGFVGGLQATGSLGDYRLAASGPWQKLNVTLSGAGLQATGKLNALRQSYSAQIAGQQSGLAVTGQVQGVGTQVTGQLRVRDGKGGWADVQVASGKEFALQAHNLNIAGQTLRGNLGWQQGQLSGTASLGGLTLRAVRGQLLATGVYAQHKVHATGRLQLPSRLTNLNIRVSGPYVQLLATGDSNRLRGSVLVRAQQLSRSGLTAHLPAQVLPLEASLTPLRINVGGLTYSGGQWGGQTHLRYALDTAPGHIQPGSLALRGAGPALNTVLGGPVGGRVQLLPRFGGAVQVDLRFLQAALLPALPDQTRAALSTGRLHLGKLQATFDRTGATFVTRGASWQGAEMRLRGRADWRASSSAGPDVTALLTQGRTVIPVFLRGKQLQVRRATVDAWALRPFVSLKAPLSGQITAYLNAPDYSDLKTLTAQATVNLAAGDQVARGQLTYSGGQVAGNLSSTLGNVEAQVSGPLYPRANATVRYGDLRGTVQGDARQMGQGRWLARLGGRYQGKPVSAVASISPSQVALRAEVAGASMQAQAQIQAQAQAQSQTQAQHSVWAVRGRFSAGDLRPLAGVAGNLSSTFAGTVGGNSTHLSAQLLGVVAGSHVVIPVRYQGGVVRVSGGQVSTPISDGTARTALGGVVWPRLNLKGQTVLNTLSPGVYTLSATGPISRPTVRASGTLQDLYGFGVAGTRLQAVLSGKDFRVQASGKALSGTFRGRTDMAGYVQRAQLHLNLPYRDPGNPKNALWWSGPAAWNAAQGWSGASTVQGQWQGQALRAQMQGYGVLGFEASYGPAQASGTLGSNIWQKPSGTLRLQSLDIGRLWQRPGQLQVTGQAHLSGTSWQTLEARFAGQLLDMAGGDLTGPISGQYQAAGKLGSENKAADIQAADIQAAGAQASVSLGGQHLSAQATLSGTAVYGSVHSRGVELARFLPPKWGVDALRLVGQADVSASLGRGLERLEARHLYLAGRQQKVGAFKLLGSAVYLPQAQQPQAQADLTGYFLGGRFTAHGNLPAGLDVQAEHLNLSLLSGEDKGAAPSVLQAQLHLLGDLQNPAISGTAQMSRPEAEVLGSISGRLQDPQAHLRAALRGSYSGVLHADISQLDLSNQLAQVRVYGTAQQGQTRLALDMAGVWPKLAGHAKANVAGLGQPVTITGKGSGLYTLSAGELGRGQVTLAGLNPVVSGSATINPLPLLGATGQGTIQLSVSGRGDNLQLTGGGLLSGVTRSGLSLPDTAVSLSGTPQQMTAQADQGGKVVASVSGKEVVLTGWQVQGAGSRLSVTGRGDWAAQRLSAQVTASGDVAGKADLQYGPGALTAAGNLSAAGLAGRFEVSANRLTGWKGSLKATGGPDIQGIGPVLSSPLNVQFSGPYSRPLATGSLGLVGAKAALVAGQSGVQLRLSSGPLTKASGVLSLNRVNHLYRWDGAAYLSRRKGQLDIAVSGEAARPLAELKGKLGQWYAAGAVSPGAAYLTYGDGVGQGAGQGTLRWDGSALSVVSDPLDLSRLELAGVSGTVQPHATGQLHATGQTASTRSAEATLALHNVVTGGRIPYLEIPLAGSGKVSATLQGEVVSAAGKLNLSAGPLSFSAARRSGLWTGQLSATFKKGAGQLRTNIALKDLQATGTVQADQLPVTVSGVKAQVTGQVALTGEQFNASLQATGVDEATGGAGAERVTLKGSGGLANLLPSLEGLTGLKPLEQGYRVQTQLAGLDLGQLSGGKVGGNVSGQLLLGEGTGTFVLRSNTLKLGDSVLNSRVDGTLAGGDWRLRGHIGDSTLFGAVTGGKLSARMQMLALPVGSVVTAFTGQRVGEGLLTGIARVEAPLDDPLSGTAVVVAERLKVTVNQQASAAASSAAAETTAPAATGTEVLIGQGSLNFANRELTHIQLAMGGAGTWDVRGQYTRQNVDLQANFNNTTFTPILALLPNLKNQATLHGNLGLSVTGDYQQPTASLNGQDLTGTWAGMQARVPSLHVQLNDGALSGQASIAATGTVGAQGTAQLGGQFASSQLSGVTLSYQGALSAESLGDLGQTEVHVTQGEDNNWQVDALAQQGGSLKVAGQFSPKVNLQVTAQNYNLPIRTLYARESNLNGALTAVTEGENIVVNGDLNFARMLLGRVATTPLVVGAGDKSAAARYVSPLPTALTTFTDPDEKTGTVKIAIPFLNRVVFNNVPIRAPGNIRVDESVAQAELSADLVLSGTGDNPLLTGEIRNLRGSLTLRDNEFSIQNAVAKFDGSSVYPNFSLTAQGQVPDSAGNRVGVQLQADGDFGVQEGKAERVLGLRTALSCTTCSPGSTNYTEAELYSLLALGTSDITALTNSNNLTSLGTSAVSTALNMFVLGELQHNIAKALGLDVFRINGNLINADGSVDARFTVGTYLSKQFYVQYQVDLTGAGLLDATYTTEDGRFTFKASTPLSGFDLGSVQPSFSASYNIGTRHSVAVGLESGKSTKYSVGYVFRW